MNRFSGTICRVLIACMIALPHGAGAGMIGTDDAIVTAPNAVHRDAANERLSREKITAQLQALGVPPALAHERVAALSAREADQIAGQLGSLPAGGVSSWVWVVLVLFVAGLLWGVYGPDSPWRNRPI